jgi:hypothetical protein
MKSKSKSVYFFGFVALIGALALLPHSGSDDVVRLQDRILAPDFQMPAIADGAEWKLSEGRS